MIRILAGGLAGALLGAVYFGGLWLTVRRLSRMGRPAPWLVASYLGRLVVAGAGFGLLIALGGLPAVASALVGFLAVRFSVIRRWGAADGPLGPSPHWRDRSCGISPRPGREA